MAELNDTILTLGLVGGGLYIVSKLSQGFTGIGSGVSDAIEGTGSGIRDATTSAGRNLGTVFDEAGQTISAITDVQQNLFNKINDQINYNYAVGQKAQEEALSVFGALYNKAKSSLRKDSSPSYEGTAQDFMELINKVGEITPRIAPAGQSYTWDEVDFFPAETQRTVRKESSRNDALKSSKRKTSSRYTRDLRTGKTKLTKEQVSDNVSALERLWAKTKGGN